MPLGLLPKSQETSPRTEDVLSDAAVAAISVVRMFLRVFGVVLIVVGALDLFAAYQLEISTVERFYIGGIAIAVFISALSLFATDAVIVLLMRIDARLTR